MKKIQQIFAVTLFFTLLFPCCKEPDPVVIEEKKEYFTDLGDLLLHTNVFVSWEERSYDLDLDRDSVADLTIKIHSSYHTLIGQTYFIQFNPLNGYEILFTEFVERTWRWAPSWPDTLYSYQDVNIPRCSFAGDLIRADDTFSGDSIMIAYSFTPSTRVTTVRDSGINRRQWIMNDYGYVAFRKITPDTMRLAWLKVQVLHPYVIRLHSCKFFENKPAVLIAEE